MDKPKEGKVMDLPCKCQIRRCDICGGEWVVSVKVARKKRYICPHCRRKEWSRAKEAESSGQVVSAADQTPAEKK